MRGLRVCVVVVIVASLAATACGSGSSRSGRRSNGGSAAQRVVTKAGNVSTVGACPVTDLDVQTATGATRVSADAPHGGYPGAQSCGWYLDDRTAGHTISVLLLQGGRSSFERTAHAPTGPDELADGSPYEPVAGLGDQAIASGVGGDVNLDVLRGEEWINVTSYDYPRADPSRKTAKGLSTDALDGCIRIARAALAKAQG